MNATFLTLLVIFASVAADDIPANWKKCRRSDPGYSKCLDEAVTAAIISMASGAKHYKIPPIEPMSVESVKIGENNGPVSIKQEYRNIKLHGLTKGLTLKNYKVDFENHILSSESDNTQVDFVADYELNGQVLVLPIHGKGHSNITMINLHSTSSIYCEPYQKNGETYWKVKKYEVKFRPGKVILKFGNLFEGDNTLGEEMNKFINENSDLLFSELQSAYEETFGLLFAKITNNIFKRIPASKLFPE